MYYEKYTTRDVHKELADKYGLNKAVVEMICNHPFVFTKKCMSDGNNEYPIMFANMFKIRVKSRYTGGKKKFIRDKYVERSEAKKELLEESSN